MYGLLGLVLLAIELPDAENLLSNPGFEVAVADRPARWDLFLMPQDGAFARLDGTARSGAYAAMIHVPLPYPKDPFNNWSQNVLGDVAGKSFRLSGYIKAQDVQDAALWAQCWRRRPLALLHTASTSETAPIYGVMDWREVETIVHVPAGTDFLTIRCVLKGAGTAWFDDLSLSPLGAAETETQPTRNAPVTARPAGAAPSQSTPAEALPAAAPVAASKPDKSSHRPRAETRQQDDALLREVARLRAELEDVRAQLEAAMARPDAAASQPAPDPFVSPIVPHYPRQEE